jgi:uncharacterized protein YggU (UPF0235/DUF167 family)
VAVRIRVRVVPRSSRESLEVDDGGGLRVRVSAAPEGGKANAAVCSVLAKALGVPKSAVRVVRGESARDKVLEVDGDDAAVTAALRGVIGGREGS